MIGRCEAKVAPERATTVPSAALILGWLGVTPFLGPATAIAAWMSFAFRPALAGTRGLAPAWYASLRMPLTAVVIACLLVPTAVLAI